jgi:hypothetical protein
VLLRPPGEERRGEERREREAQRLQLVQVTSVGYL